MGIVVPPLEARSGPTFSPENFLPTSRHLLAALSTELLKSVRSSHNHTVVDRLSTAFIALSDPTRRLILERLARGAASVNELAEPFRISQQAISKHLAYLERAALIEKRKEGRHSVCTLRPEALDEVVAWVRQCRAFWEESFDRLEGLVEEVKAKERKRARR